MRSDIDETHDPALMSWVEDANGHSEFPIQNLPLGIFSHQREMPQAGVAIGDHILSLNALSRSGLLEGDAQIACEVAVGKPTLNDVLGMGPRYRRALRKSISKLTAHGREKRPELLYLAVDCELKMPLRVGDYSDFYAGIHHAENVGRMFRPEHPLLPNYKWVPIGYHGRSSTLQVTGDAVVRPKGQRKRTDELSPTYGPTCELDFELELGIWVGSGNVAGDTIAIDDAEQHISGYCLLNDWSARDIQSWEYQPLGPFLGKSFHSTVSGWVVTQEALAPFRNALQKRSVRDPEPLPYLRSKRDGDLGGLAVDLEVFLTTVAMREKHMSPYRLTRTSAVNLYWTPAQLVTHQASNGCNLSPGDLLGTGTISSDTMDGLGSLLELTKGGSEPVHIVSGEQRRYLEDGDEISFHAHASREGAVTIGFGECRARVREAKE